MAASATPTEMLAQERDTARQLMVVLQEEQGQLVKADIDGLGALIEKKAALIGKMAELSKARLNALTLAGFVAEEASMEKWLNSPQASAKNNPEVKKTWEELRALVRTTRELNRTNGLLISTQMSHNQVALQVLQGNQASQVYGPNGQTSVQTSSRSVVVG